MRQTNPISPGRRRIPEANTQNKAKLGWTGVYRQSRLPCGARPGVKRAKRTQFGDRRPRDCGLRIERRRIGQRPCETNPISPGRRRIPEANTQNKAKPGWTGVYRQSRFPCGGGPGVKRAKRTQFGDRRPRDCGLRIERRRIGQRPCETNPICGRGPGIADCGLKDVGRAWRGAALHAGATHEEGKCAKRTQFGPRGG
jgi:hypothetical protein